MTKLNDLRNLVNECTNDSLDISGIAEKVIFKIISAAGEYEAIKTLGDLKGFLQRHPDKYCPGLAGLELEGTELLENKIFWAIKAQNEKKKEEEPIAIDPEMLDGDEVEEDAISKAARMGIEVQLGPGVKMVSGDEIFGKGKDPVKALKELQQQGMRGAFMNALEEAAGKKFSPEVRNELEKALKEADDNREKNDWEMREERKNNPQVRYAKAGMTVADLEKAIREANEEDCEETDLYPREDSHFLDDVLADVGVDFENNERFYDPEIINGVPVVWCRCGGDWEFPLWYCLYIGEDGEVHAYVPKEGNTYNKFYHCAFGSEDDYKDIVPEEVRKKTCKRDFDNEDGEDEDYDDEYEDEPEEDMGLMRKDIMAWIKIRGQETEGVGKDVEEKKSENIKEESEADTCIHCDPDTAKDDERCDPDKCEADECDRTCENCDCKNHDEDCDCDEDDDEDGEYYDHSDEEIPCEECAGSREECASCSLKADYYKGECPHADMSYEDLCEDELCDYCEHGRLAPHCCARIRKELDCSGWCHNCECTGA